LDAATHAFPCGPAALIDELARDYIHAEHFAFR
jgi:hypothetical protein